MSQINKTSLSVDQAERRGFLHRDYIAHCFRWTHIVRELQRGALYKRAHILDIGCGKEVPLAKLLYSSKLIYTSGSYTGVDVVKMSDPAPDTDRFNPTLIRGLFPDVKLPRPRYDVIVSLETIEHVSPSLTRIILEGIYERLTASGVAFISTPCWDPAVGAAGNHPNEITYEALGSLLEDLGFEILGHWGTFASIKDYKGQLEEDGFGDLFKELREYYDTNVLATFFAPLYPHLARNCLWELSCEPGENYERSFLSLADVDEPWTSNKNWRDLDG